MRHIPAYCAAGTTNIGSCASNRQIGQLRQQPPDRRRHHEHRQLRQQPPDRRRPRSKQPPIARSLRQRERGGQPQHRPQHRLRRRGRRHPHRRRTCRSRRRQCPTRHSSVPATCRRPNLSEPVPPPPPPMSSESSSEPAPASAAGAPSGAASSLADTCRRQPYHQRPPLHHQLRRRFFLVEGALYYERDTEFQEPNALNTLYSSPSGQIPAMTSSSW